MKWQPRDTEWADYYEDTSYSHVGFQHKKEIVASYIDTINPKCVWDLGGNVGVFSRIASDKGINTISFDIDPAAVEKNYLDLIAGGETNILPLILDLTNPSPAIGWGNHERMSLSERGPADAVLALALIHHLAISNNVPLGRIAEFLSGICHWMIIEFIPKSDSQVQRLLSTREDVFADYSIQSFEDEFGRFFIIHNSQKVRDSERTLYLMEKKSIHASN
jgi:ribosomal protein L11 methylase PrmA